MIPIARCANGDDQHDRKQRRQPVSQASPIHAVDDKQKPTKEAWQQYDEAIGRKVFRFSQAGDLIRARSLRRFREKNFQRSKINRL